MERIRSPKLAEIDNPNPALYNKLTAVWDSGTAAETVSYGIGVRTDMLEQNAAKPLYRQLMEAIQTDIEGGVYRAGDRLPTEKELEDIYKVSRITVRRAVKELCERRILVKKQGKGTFVLGEEIRGHLDDIGGFHDAMEDQEKGTSQQLLSVDEMDSDTEMARYLGMKTRGKTVVVRRLLSTDNVPVMLDTCYLSAARFPGIHRYFSGDFSIYQILREHYQVRMVSAEKVIKVRKVHRDEEELLRCNPGDPVFDLFKIVYDEEGDPVHASFSVVRGENTSYIISADNQNRLSIKSPKTKMTRMIDP